VPLRLLPLVALCLFEAAAMGLGVALVDLTGSYSLVWSAAIAAGLLAALLHFPIDGTAPAIPAPAQA